MPDDGSPSKPFVWFSAGKEKAEQAERELLGLD